MNTFILGFLVGVVVVWFAIQYDLASGKINLLTFKAINCEIFK